MTAPSVIEHSAVLDERVSVAVEATEILVETVQEFGRDGRPLTLVVAGLTEAEWEESGGVHTGPRSKVERVGPHTIEYRKGEL